MNDERIVVAAIGDVLVDRPVPASAFAKVEHLFAAADVRFANSEGPYTDTAERNASSWGWVISEPRNFEAVAGLEFDVLCLANNHTMDASYGGLTDTLRLVRDAGAQPVGAGEDLATARAPAVVERGGVRIAFLAYTCVYAPGFEAWPSRPGCATIQIHTIYRHELGQPGTRPALYTLADPPTKTEIMADIAAAAEYADVLIASFHWGIHNLPAVLTDYERELGRAAIDAGADVVLGHHQHIIKGVEIYQGKPILYGLGNFLFDGSAGARTETMQVARLAMQPFREFYGEYLGAHHLDEAKRSLFLRLGATSSGIDSVAIVPCTLDQAGDPVAVTPGDAAFEAFAQYLGDISERAGLNAEFTISGDEILVSQRPDGH